MSTKKVKAMKCWSQGGGEYWHIPATPEAYDAMVEQIKGQVNSYSRKVAIIITEREIGVIAEKALAAIGITQPKKTK